MTVWTRLVSLARADAHGAVDSLEDTALVLRQQLREAWGELGRKRARLEATKEEELTLAAEQKRLSEQRSSLDEDVQLALESEKEDLARFAVRQILGIDRREKQIEHRLRALERLREPLAEKLHEQENDYRLLEQRVQSHLADLEQNPDAPMSRNENFVRDEEVEIELLRRREQHHGVHSGSSEMDGDREIAGEA